MIDTCVENSFTFEGEHFSCLVPHYNHQPAHCRGGCYFSLDRKVTKRSSQQKGFFAAQAFTPQISQNHGLESFALLRSRIPLLLQKFLCPCHPQATMFLPAFARSCFADEEEKRKSYQSFNQENHGSELTLGSEADTGPAPKACRRMSGKPGPQGTPMKIINLIINNLNQNTKQILIN